MPQDITDLAIFEGYAIRRVWVDGRWWFSVVDVVRVLTDSPNARTYWAVLKKRLDGKELFQSLANCQQFKLPAEDGKLRETDCGDFAILLTMIQYLLLQQNIKSNKTNDEIKMGIYAIENTITGTRYIGSSSNLASRYIQHRALLRKGSHHAQALQEAWNIYGEDAFVLIILDEVDDVANLESREQFYIDSESPQYNSQKYAFNATSKEKVDLNKVNRFLIFLRECELPVHECEPLRHIEQALLWGLINPGMNYFQFMKAAQLGIKTWEEIQGFFGERGDSI